MKAPIPWARPGKHVDRDDEELPDADTPNKPNSIDIALGKGQ